MAPTAAEDFNAIRLPLVVVACWRLNHVLFDFDSSFVAPETRAELLLLSRIIDANPGSPMAIFGHADPSGDDEHNKRLSGRRARAVHAVLTRDVAAWEDLFSNATAGDTWGLRSTQRILGFLRREDGTGPYLSANATGVFDDATDEAIRAYQADHGLTVDGIAGPQTRKVLYRDYMDAICVSRDRQLVLDNDDFVVGQGAKTGDHAFQGCGEFNPVHLLSKDEAKGLGREDRNRQNAPNRRVMIILFQPGTVVAKSDWPCPRWDASGAGCHAAFWPDGDARRASGEEPREYRVDRRTMACRFYDRLAHASPCEGVVPFSVDLFFDVPKAVQELAQSFTLESHDGVFKSTRPRAEATPVQETLFVLRFKKVRPGKRYTLSYDLGAGRVPIFLDVPLAEVGGDPEEVTGPQPREHGVEAVREPPPALLTNDPLLVFYPADAVVKSGDTEESR